MIYWVLPAMVPHRTTLNRSYSMMYNLDTRILLVVESAIEIVAVNKNVHTLPFKIVKVVDD